MGPGVDLLGLSEKRDNKITLLAPPPPINHTDSPCACVRVCVTQRALSVHREEPHKVPKDGRSASCFSSLELPFLPDKAVDLSESLSCHIYQRINGPRCGVAGASILLYSWTGSVDWQLQYFLDLGGNDSSHLKSCFTFKVPLHRPARAVFTPSLLGHRS